MSKSSRFSTAVSFLNSWAEQLELAMSLNDFITMKYLLTAVSQAYLDVIAFAPEDVPVEFERINGEIPPMMQRASAMVAAWEAANE